MRYDRSTLKRLRSKPRAWPIPGTDQWRVVGLGANARGDTLALAFAAWQLQRGAR